jgi:undecaprenyl-diphosphatase
MLLNLDHAVFDALNRGAANIFLDWLMPRITNLHKEWWLAAPLLLLLLYLLWRGPRRVRVWILCAVIAIGFSDIAARRVVKNLYARDRPCRIVEGTSAPDHPGTRLVAGEECPGSPSFPSNHASNMGALAAVCWWFTRRRVRWLWMLLPLIIGFSRIYLGYHYPTDVLGGWILGALIGAGVIFALRRLLVADEELRSGGVRE